MAFVCETFLNEEKVLILFSKFMKKHNIFHLLYHPTSFDLIPNKANIEGNGYAGDLWICISHRFILGVDKKLALSQLWRFFLLENINFLDFVSLEKKISFVSNMKNTIKVNGIRGNKELKGYFEKYDIIPVEQKFIF